MVDVVPTGIETHSGRIFDYENMRPQDINIQDIAASLSKICRYNGHTIRFYSVAEHCCRLAEYASKVTNDPRAGLYMLLHDACEAYIGDHVNPMKRAVPAIQEFENKIQELICFRFGLLHPMPAFVKNLDTRILIDEKDILFPHSRHKWQAEQQGFGPLEVNIYCLPPPQAEELYLQLFQEMTGTQLKPAFRS